MKTFAQALDFLRKEAARLEKTGSVVHVDAKEQRRATARLAHDEFGSALWLFDAAFQSGEITAFDLRRVYERCLLEMADKIAAVEEEEE